MEAEKTQSPEPGASNDLRTRVDDPNDLSERTENTSPDVTQTSDLRDFQKEEEGGDGEGYVSDYQSPGEEQEEPEERQHGERVLGSLSGLPVSPSASVERVPTHRAEWAALESAESRVQGPLPLVRTLTPEKKPVSAIATELYTFSYLVFFSIFGALARIGLQALTFYPGAPVITGVVWANVGGCLVMGFLAEDRNLFREEWGLEAEDQERKASSPHPHHPNVHHRHQHPHPHQHLSPEESLKAHKATKKTIPLYIGLTTGFCGSFTSFSTFMRDSFLALTNDLPDPSTGSIVPRNGGYSFMAVVAVLLYTISLSLCALIFGSHLAALLDKVTPTLSFTFMRKFLDRLAVFLGIGCWLGAVFLAIWPPDRDQGIHQTWRGRAVFATIFAPLGCLFRFYVSLLLNARVPTFPLGTFFINIFGTMIEGMCYDLKFASKVVALGPGISTTLARVTGCQVLDGVMDGFCGCTTTVSTWVAELDSLELRYSYRYGIVTLAAGLAFMVVIMGSMGWTEGFATPAC